VKYDELENGNSVASTQPTLDMPEVTDSTVKLHLKSGQECTVYKYGATVTSWKVGTERIFVSDKAVLNGTKAIRGGIPLVFPQFGSVAGSKLPQHGFARNSTWKWDGVETETDDEILVSFSLSPEQVDPKLFELWPHPFKLEYKVRLGKSSLQTNLVVTNTGSESFSFTTLLHTYFTVKDISDVKIAGLKGVAYQDKVAGGKHTESRDLVDIKGEVDRVYENCKQDLLVTTGNGDVAIKRLGLEDVVVWNPAADKAKAMADLGEDAFPKFLCVEAGAVAKSVDLAPGKSWTGGQTLSV
jgi:glucose-6-phosphate 1-epimerase